VQAADGLADRRAHPLELVLAPLVDGELEPRRTEPADACRDRDSFELNPLKGAFIQIMPLTWGSFLLSVMDRHLRAAIGAVTFVQSVGVIRELRRESLRDMLCVRANSREAEGLNVRGHNVE
jgi:hypothetical protein